MKTKIQTLKEEINDLTDPRRTSYGNIRHKLEDIIIIGLCTMICGGEDYADMEAFGIEREKFLRRFLELPDRCVIAVDEIIDAGAEYCIALKGNRPMLCQDVEDYFCAYAGKASTDKHLEKGHGRIEIREYYLSCDIGRMEQEEEWVDLRQSEW